MWGYINEKFSKKNLIRIYKAKKKVWKKKIMVAESGPVSVVGGSFFFFWFIDSILYVLIYQQLIPS